jgi:hypothetical protein
MSYSSIIKENSQLRNYEGEKAYKMSAELELYSAAVTSMLNDNSYQSYKERFAQIAKLIKQVDPTFVAKLAVYIREEMHLRSIPLFLIVALAKIHNGDDLVCKTINRVVMRADEIMELLTCYQMCNADDKSTKKLNHLSRQVQNGLKLAFNKFDEYQFAKYNRNNLEVKLKDALFLVHPKAKDENQQIIFDKIAFDNLDIPYTWETELSKIGQIKYSSSEEKKQAKRDCWTNLIKEDKLGYMAMLRNLRNLLNVGVDNETLNIVQNKIASQDAVLHSKQLPYRFLSAFREIKNVEHPKTRFLVDALEEAVLYSANNIRYFGEDESVLLACDVSGSMQTSVSKKSTIMYYDIGILLASILKVKCKNVVAGLFGDSWLPLKDDFSSKKETSHILEYTEYMHRRAGEVGYSTNGYKVINWLLSNQISMDKVMFFTDMQMWDSDYCDEHIEKSWKKYKQKYPEAKLYLFDLAGYGQLPLRMQNNDVYLISGWSDKIFDMLEAYENGSNAVEKIKKIEILI